LANEDISFEVRRGECLCLIGHNGAGKTTLLKMLNGLIKPDTGSIQMRGRIGAMIALGAGFNPILTGRENIYVNGSILGLHKKEIDAKLEEIVDFAEINDAIDAPVRTYSSGMQVRLGFAVSVVLVKPDILLLDEVLAVGDIAFRVKCYNAIDVLRRDTAVILVSHSMEHISRITQRCLVLDGGKPVHLGTTDTSLPIYKSLASNITKTGQVELYTVGKIKAVSGPKHIIPESRDIKIPINLTLLEPCEITMRAVISDSSMKVAAEMRDLSLTKELRAGQSTLNLKISELRLQGGEYVLNLNFYDAKGAFIASAGNVARISGMCAKLGECAYQPHAELTLKENTK
jgi:lipopolysaccharide transport system ATP-binding protein